MNVIDIADLTVRYGKAEALAGASLSVQPGEVVCVLGPNGAGKSTLINVLLGLRTADTGSARLFGGKPEHAQVRARVGAMLQEAEMAEGLNVAEVVRLIGRYYPYRLPVSTVLGQAGLTESRGKRVGELSGGQRQRLSFALALAGDPDLLLLDEPTVAMDVEGRGAFWRRIRELADAGKTVLFSTHYLTEADAYADRVVILHHGQVIRDGTAQQIKSLVAAKTVSMVTDAPRELLLAVPGVQNVSISPREEVNVQCTRPEEVLNRLVESGYPFTELTVVDSDLETAFLALTQETAA